MGDFKKNFFGLVVVYIHANTTYLHTKPSQVRRRATGLGV